MDRELLLIVALVVTASGCIHNSGNIQTPASDSGQGLQVSTFDISDRQLGPGQTGLVTVELQNYHEQEIDIQDISLYNTGVLEVEKQGCSPPPEELERAREDYIPGLQCTWSAKIAEDEVDNFNSKTIPIKLNLAYESQISNSDQPLKLHFQPLEDIERTNDVQESFSNGEVEMVLETESPVQFEGGTIGVTVRNAGPGRVDSDYSFSYFPGEVFNRCPGDKEPLVEQEVQFVCDIDPQTDNSQTRNLVVSTSYKYVKAPTLDVEVVNR